MDINVLLKIAIAPVLMGLVTWLERKYGPRLSGIIIGLPLTSGPISLFLCSEQGLSFAKESAIGTIAGTTACAAFAAGYALACNRGFSWAACLGFGTAAFAMLALSLPQLGNTATVLAFAVAALTFCWVVVDRAYKANAEQKVQSISTSSNFDLVLRLLLATTIIAGLTMCADKLGAHVSGVLSALPILSAILLACNQSTGGAPGALKVAHGLATGCFAVLAFFTTIVLAPSSLAVGTIYASATVTAAFVALLTSDQTTIARFFFSAGTGAKSIPCGRLAFDLTVSQVIARIQWL